MAKNQVGLFRGYDRFRGDDRFRSSSSYHNASAKHIKLDFPKFSGVEPMTWIFRAEQYFAYYNTLDWQRVIVASVNFEVDVVPWFQLLQRSHVITDWPSLIKAIEEEYGPLVYEKPRVRLFKLSQSGSAEEYCREFMALANRTEGVTERLCWIVLQEA